MCLRFNYGLLENGSFARPERFTVASPLSPNKETENDSMTKETLKTDGEAQESKLLYI